MSKRYNIINDSLGWLCFVIAAVTYLLTIEPTASFWDCPEFISQGYKLEVGHPPGNPIFMLTARFFVTVFGGGAQTAAVAVNSMSAILSAATILLLFWTVTHLIRRLIVSDGSAPSRLQTVLIMAGGLCGALAYTWSDTFWFSAVEGEVYAFSSFCTALVFWLILKWENRADDPRSDRYLILIAYIIGISIAVHLLNLLCIPAIGLVIYYRKFRHTNVKGSLTALCIAAAAVALILFGLVPGFISVAQVFELFFVNVLHMGYNTGVLVYAIIVIGVFIWTIRSLRAQKSLGAMKWGVFLSIVLSGMPFMGHGWVLPVLVLIPALIVYLWMFCKRFPVRIFNVIIWSVFVIFIGYSSYALLLIRAGANTPMNQNAPDNVFALSSYLNREQYGESPLLYGPVFGEGIVFNQQKDPATGETLEFAWVDESGMPETDFISTVAYDDEGNPIDNGTEQYTPVVKSSPDEPDRYVRSSHNADYQLVDGMGMLFSRMYSDNPVHSRGYQTWTEWQRPELAIPADVRAGWAQRGYVTRGEIMPYTQDMVLVEGNVAINNQLVRDPVVFKPGIGTNLKYFVNYQLWHMYWRYFLWNFAGRQNDMAGNGEPYLGNWISGIPALDNARLGDQSLLPEEYTTGNPGHNVFYMLPLLLGLIGLLWQALMTHKGGPKRGIEQFWVIFFLFFMTGIAIVLYLNQPPGQPRERDYAFAGSFYAFAIWIGLGIPGLYKCLMALLGKFKANGRGARMATATVACVAAVGVPLQMVSQTWDDHDRSGRYCARDFGMNYLNSLDPDAIIFVNGDNDTFPLWYAQEVEGVRTDVKVVNLSYLSTDWYANQISSPSYNAMGVPMSMTPQDWAYGSFRFESLPPVASIKINPGPVTPDQFLREGYTNRAPELEEYRLFYAENGLRWNEDNAHLMPRMVHAPLDSALITVRYGSLPAGNQGYWDLTAASKLARSAGGLTPMLTYDIIANSAMGNFKRPVYFATTVGSDNYLGFSDNMFITGMAYEVTPFSKKAGNSPVAWKAYDNIVGKFKWGGIDRGRKVYLDETVRRMVTSTRLSVLTAARELLDTPDKKAPETSRLISRRAGLPIPATYADMARNLLNYTLSHMPADNAPYENGIDVSLAQLYAQLGIMTGNQADLTRARNLIDGFVTTQGKMMRYLAAADPGSRTYRTTIKYAGAELNYLFQAWATLNLIDMARAAMNDPKALQAGIDAAFKAYGSYTDDQTGQTIPLMGDRSLIADMFMADSTTRDLTLLTRGVTQAYPQSLQMLYTCPTDAQSITAAYLKAFQDGNESSRAVVGDLQILAAANAAAGVNPSKYMEQFARQTGLSVPVISRILSR